MDFHAWFLVLFYGFAVCFKAYEVIHAIHQRRQERKLVEILNNFDERCKSCKALDK